MKDYYLLIGLNIKNVKIIDIKEEKYRILEVSIKSRKKKVGCLECNFIKKV